MVGDRQELLTSSEVSQEQKVIKLRVSYGGSFYMDAAGKWGYKNGKSHLESLPVHSKYNDVAFRWTEKVKGDLTGLKYQLPGEELEPDALISVSDDSDLHEMYEEYFRGLNLPGTPANTFRLRVFLFFDMIQEPLTPAEYEDGCAFFRTASGRRIGKHDWEESSFGSNASMTSAGTAAAHRHHDEQAAIAAREVEYLHAVDQEDFGQQDMSGLPWQDTILVSMQRASNVTCLLPHKLSDTAFELSPDPSTLTSLSNQGGRYTYRTQSWYASPEQTPAGALVTLNAVTSNKKPKGDSSAYVTPVQSPRGVAGGGLGLPSHISVFGDDQPDEDDAYMGGVRLPSHISAFGDGDEDDLACAVKGLKGTAHLHPPGAGSGFGVQQVAGVHNVYGQQVVLSYDKEALLLGGSVAMMERSGSGSTNPSNANYLNVHRVAKDEVKVLGRIGEGAFGEVSLATCAIFGKVAVKWLKPGKVAAHSASFWREADMLASLNHPNVLRFYGAVVASPEDPSVVGIMTEYMRGGSLSQFLMSCTQGVIPLRVRAELALHAVNGLAYLHEMQIVHFDLKPDNLLLDGPLILGGYAGAHPVPTLKVADFGLSKHKWSNYVTGVKDLRGTLPYMAPELVSDPDHVSEKADVWSLGMVLWEMLTLQAPFQSLAPQQIIAGLMVGNMAPEVPHWCEPEWRGLMEACWEVNPSSRPSFRTLAGQLEKIIEAAPVI
ncbi:g7895 [Coccomyxa elongata]